MKKKRWIWISCAAVPIVLIVLFVPFSVQSYDDGGTRQYTSLTYRIMKWNHLVDQGRYQGTTVYWFPDNRKSCQELWDKEKAAVQKTLTATIDSRKNGVVTLTPVHQEDQALFGKQMKLSESRLAGIGDQKTRCIEITYMGTEEKDGKLLPNVTACRSLPDQRGTDYTETWLDASKAESAEDDYLADIKITVIYDNCFFAETVIPSPYEIKINGTLSSEWCCGDQVICTNKNVRIDTQSHRIEADMLTIAASTFTPDPNACYKPVIYLYPTQKTDVSVSLQLNGALSCTYPDYGDGWSVTALPDGTLIDRSGQSYNYLYWEGNIQTNFDFSKGFCVPGKDTAAFLETALAKLGLSRKEANEFIVYWLPLMQDHPYNIISFQNEAYTDAAKLTVSPAPDTLIRVFMTFKPTAKAVQLPPQTLTAPKRSGFTVLEWGGTQIPS